VVLRVVGGLVRGVERVVAHVAAVGFAAAAVVALGITAGL